MTSSSSIYIYGTREIFCDQFSKYHYTYRITNKINGIHYYGVRSSSKSPYLDLGNIYFSSSKYVKESIKQFGLSSFKFKIIKCFTDRQLANKHEIFLHEKFDVGTSNKFFNKAKSRASGFSIQGIPIHVGEVTVFDVEEGISKHITSEEYWSDRNRYKHFSEGMVTVLDLTDGLRKQIPKQEYFNNRDRYKGLHTGYTHTNDARKRMGIPSIDKVVAYDKITNKTYQIAKDLFYSMPERYTHPNKGRKFSEDIRKKIADSRKNKIKVIDKTTDILCTIDKSFYDCQKYEMASQIVDILDSNVETCCKWRRKSLTDNIRYFHINKTEAKAHLKNIRNHLD
jgi:hypothetical protein